jgi:hypothetical protein
MDEQRIEYIIESLIKNGLSIEVKVDQKFGSKSLRVDLKYFDHVVSTDWVDLPEQNQGK